MPTLLLAPTLLCVLTPAQAPPINPGAVRRLDQEAQAAEQAFLDELDTLAEEYERAGATEKAKATIQRRLRVQSSERLKAKLKELDELVFTQNVHTVKLDSARGWFNTGCDVQPNATIRLAADGTYRLAYSQQLTPAGVSTADMTSDYIESAPLGALVAAVFPPRPVGRPPRGRKRDEKQSEPSAPFTVGTGGEMKPDRAGRLFVRLNLPPETKATGTVTVTISGQFSVR